MQRRLGVDPEEEARTLSPLGDILTHLAEYDDAEQTLLEAHQILRTARGDDNTRTIAAGRSLVELYEAWDRPEDAAERRAKLPAEERAAGVEER